MALSVARRSQFVSKAFCELSWTHRESIDFVKWPREVSSSAYRRAILEFARPERLTSLRIRLLSQTIIVPHISRHLTRLSTLVVKPGHIPRPPSRFSGATLDHLSNSLTHLDLQSCTIDDQGLSGIGRYLSRLQVLNLAECKIISDDGVAVLSGCTALTTLSLESTIISGDCFRFLSTLANLGALSLRACVRITERGASHLSVLTSLCKLSLSGNYQLSGLPFLSSLTKLDRLNIKETAVRDSGIVGLFDLTNLKKLEAARCSRITALTMDRLSHTLVKLEDLDLHGALIPPTCNLPKIPQMLCVASMPNLTKLNLRKCRIQDMDLGYIAQCHKMRTLLLSRCDHITTQGVGLLGFLTGLEFLSLNHCTQVQYEVITHFHRMRCLRELEMAYVSADTSGVGFLALKPIKTLRSLQVRLISSRGVDLSDVAFGGIYHLTQLTSLHISGASYEALLVIPVWAERLQDLTYLKVAGNSVNDEWMSRLGSAPLPHLSTLIIDTTVSQFTSDGVFALGASNTSLRSLALSNSGAAGSFDFASLWAEIGAPIATNLTKLTLRGAPASADAILCLTALANLRELSLINASRLTDSGMRRLAALKKLRKLDVSGSIQVTAGGVVDLVALSASLRHIRCADTNVRQFGSANVMARLSRECSISVE